MHAQINIFGYSTIYQQKIVFDMKPKVENNSIFIIMNKT